MAVLGLRLLVIVTAVDPSRRAERLRQARRRTADRAGRDAAAGIERIVKLTGPLAKLSVPEEAGRSRRCASASCSGLRATLGARRSIFARQDPAGVCCRCCAVLYAGVDRHPV